LVVCTLPRHSLAFGAMKLCRVIAIWALWVAGCGDSDTTTAPPVIRFEDVTMARGVPTAGMPCVALHDFDHDGHLDLLVAPATMGGPPLRALALLLGRGDGPFERHDIPIPVDVVTGCTVGDIDQDGWADIVVAGFGMTGSGVVLLHAAAGGVDFSATQVADADAVSTLALFDVDGDGWPDLYLGFPFQGFADQCTVTPTDFHCTAPDPNPHPPRPPLVLHNRAGAGFGAAAPGPFPAHYDNGVLPVDWDEDGRVDLLVSTDFGANFLFLNQGGGVFTDVLGGLGANPYNHAMGMALADFDRDGRWDAYVGDLGPDELYFGRADGQLEDRAQAAGITAATRTHSGWSPAAADFNNDGELDVYVVNAAVVPTPDDLGHLLRSEGFDNHEAQVDYLFTGSGSGRFTSSPVGHRTGGYNIQQGALAVGDLDDDGLLDLAVVTTTTTAEIRLLHNVTVGPGHWLGVELHGPGGVREVAAAVVTLWEGGQQIDRRLAGGGGGTGVSSERLHFGLGARSQIDRLTVRWPGGLMQTVEGPIAADRTLVVEATSR
jgi:hypothetical protein